MEPAAVVERLIDAGVFDPVDAGEGFVLRPAVRQRIEDRRREFERAEPAVVEDRLASIVDDPERRSVLAARAGDAPGLLARYVTLRETFEDLEDDACLQAALALDQLDGDPPRDDGAPTPFLPVRAGDLGAVAALYDRAVAYVWRDRCPSCDDVRAMLEALFADGAEDLGLLATYGPADPPHLRDAFEVVGGPTTLFMLDGRVDARLTGTPDRRALEREVQRLREQSR